MNKHTQLAILVIFLSMVWCEVNLFGETSLNRSTFLLSLYIYFKDQMSLHVSVVDPYEDKKLNNPVETPNAQQENLIDDDEQVEDGKIFNENIRSLEKFSLSQLKSLIKVLKL